MFTESGIFASLLLCFFAFRVACGEVAVATVSYDGATAFLQRGARVFPLISAATAAPRSRWALCSAARGGVGASTESLLTVVSPQQSRNRGFPLPYAGTHESCCLNEELRPLAWPSRAQRCVLGRL